MAENDNNDSPSSTVPQDDEGMLEVENTESAYGIVGTILERFRNAEAGRQLEEERWLKAYKNYRGVYDSSTQYRSTERSQVFIKITKTKVLAAYGQIVDILFANNKFPISVDATPMPEGIDEFAHLSQIPVKEPEVTDPFGFPGDGNELLPGALEATPMQDESTSSAPTAANLGGLEDKYAGANLASGPAKLGEPQIEPANEAARVMEKCIHDQLLDTSAVTVMRHAIFECALLGTGVIKGPFNYNKTVHDWTSQQKEEEQQQQEGMSVNTKTYQPYDKTVPRIEAVSCWDFYPDPSATNINDAEYVIQRHRMNREQLRDLTNRPHFDAEAISTILGGGPNYQERYFEASLHANEDDPTYSSNRYEVYEYWGSLDRKLAEEFGMDLEEHQDSLESIQVNIWVCGSEILRFVANPFIPARIPYHSFPFELNPYQLFGVGVAENMEDSQLLMNGHMRMAIDNLALAGHLVFDIDETQLVPGQSYDVFPGKVFRRQSGVTGTAVNGIKFPNTAPENMQMYDKARQLADEQTGIPSIVHGQTGVTGTGRTAAGLSMLMSSAGLSIKTVIKNVDDFLLKPLGEAFFQWNMQFNEKTPEKIGDLEIKPKGTSAVIQKEVRTQRLTALLQTVANPMLAPFIKIPNLIRELAISQDIDPDALVNDVNEAAVFAEVLRGLNERTTGEAAPPTGQQPTGVGGLGGVPQGVGPNDATAVGGGGIGIGSAPTAGEAGFTGNTGETQEIG